MSMFHGFEWDEAQSPPWWASTGMPAQPALYLNFTSGVYRRNGLIRDLDQIMGFARATPATYVDADGAIQTAAIDEPRFDWTGGERALLLEAAATNLLSDSANFSSWSQIVCTTTVNNTPSPEGDYGGDTVTATVGGNARVQKIAPYVEGESRTFSCFLRAGQANGWLGVHRGNAGNTTVYAKFDLSGEGSVTATRNTVSSSIMYFGGGWYRCAISFVFPSGWTGAFFAVGPWDGSDDSYDMPACRSGESVALWGAQLETGSVATSYTPTTTTAVTRASDLVTAPIAADVSGGVRVRGTFRLDGNTDQSGRIFQIDDDSINNAVILMHRPNATAYIVQVRAGGMFKVDRSVVATLGETVDVDIMFFPESFIGTLDGVPVSASWSGAVSGLSTARIGSSVAGGMPARLLCSEFIVAGVPT